MTVFIVQDQKHVDPKQDNQLVSKFDFTAAKKFGKLFHLLKPSASPFAIQPVLEKLHFDLKTFNDDDYLLLVGSPVLIGCAVAVAADYNDGNVNLLQWSGAKRDYVPVKIKNLFNYQEPQ